MPNKKKKVPQAQIVYTEHKGIPHYKNNSDASVHRLS